MNFTYNRYTYPKDISNSIIVAIVDFKHNNGMPAYQAIDEK